ncbi:MAG: EAL domain-containing protein, partial [Spirochaetaceae bacterium]|nr:EAL domain-containing protein [Spirochaetaceae bacterium]
TGYSSFATLRDYPVDTVKLPQSFVDPLPDDGRASLIAGAVIDLAHNLDFSVVAEGVETMAQLAWLDRACCDHFQGFLFAPPMPGSEFEVELAGVGRTMLN